MRLGLGLGIVKSAASIYKGILDKFPNAVAAYSTRKLKTSYPTTLPADYGGGAAAAYSLRKVKSDYGGSAVKVRRSSDGGLQDIGFDSNGNLDTTALDAFVNEDVEKIVNGDFATDTDWTKGTGWSIADGKASSDGSQTTSSSLFQACLAIGQTHNFTMTITDYASGSVLLRNGSGTSEIYISAQSANGTYTATAVVDGGGTNSTLVISASADFVGSVSFVSAIQTTADGHVTRWYSQSDNTPTGGLSITDEYGTTIDNVLELNCDNTNDTEHPLRKNNPFGASNPINGKTLKCSFKMLVPSGQTGLVGAALSDGNITTGGVLSDGKVTEQGRWTTFTDVAWTQTALQSRLIFMGLDSSDDPEFVATAGDKFYIADVVLTETTDAYNGTDSQQPLIVEGGDVVLENGKPTIKFDADDDFLQTSFAAGVTDNWFVAGVQKVNNLTGIKYSYGGRDTSGDGTIVFASNDTLNARVVGTTIQANPIGTDSFLYIQELSATNNTHNLYFNGVLADSEAASSINTTTNIRIGRAAYVDSGVLDGLLQELIFFNSDQSGNRKDIEWNINNHYSIYDQWDRESCMNVRRSSDNATQDIGFSGKNINQTQLESFVNDASPVLDDYTGAAAAYSLRKVRSAYTGSAINVRRSSDGDTKDIGFDANGDLDTTTLLAFVGGENKVVQSENLNTTWSKSSATPTASTEETPDGDTTSKFIKLVDDNAGGTGVVFQSQNITLKAATQYAMSAYFKADGVGWVRLQANDYDGSNDARAFFNLSTGAVGTELNLDQSATMTDVGNGWYRCTIVFTMGASDTSIGYVIGLADADNDFVVDLDGTSSIFAWGMMVNQGNSANTYISTTTGIAGDGAVTTWYDQAGINNATADCSNPSACEQPLIVEAGDVVLDNNKPAIDFDGVDDYFTGAVKTTMDNTAIFAVIKSDSNTQDSVFIQNTVDINNCVALGLGGLSTNSKIGSRLRVGGSTIDRVGDATFTATDQTLVSYLADNTAGQMFIDGTEETDIVDSRSEGTATTIGARGDGNSPFNGAIQEVIFFESDQSSNRTGIEGNIGRYYNITGYRDGFVTKWFDQSGNFNHAENSTDTEQPQIVSSGSVETLGSKVTPVRQGVTTTLDVSGVESSVTGAFTIATRFYLSSQSDLDCIFGGRGLTAGAGLCASYLSGAWRFEVVTTTGTRAIVIVSDSNTPINNWYNVIFTWDGTTDSNAVKVYLNTSSNVFTATANGTVINYDASHPMSIFNANRNSFDGGLATWDIWNSQITDIDGLFSAMEH
jgi:hypothetical protein